MLAGILDPHAGQATRAPLRNVLAASRSHNPVAATYFDPSRPLMTCFDYLVALYASGLLLVVFVSVACFWRYRLKQACRLLIQAKPTWAGLDLDEATVTALRAVRKRVEDFLRDVDFRE